MYSTICLPQPINIVVATRGDICLYLLRASPPFSNLYILLSWSILRFLLKPVVLKVKTGAGFIQILMRILNWELS